MVITSNVNIVSEHVLSNVMGLLMTSRQEAEELSNSSNGFILSNIFIPEEVLINIISFVDWKDLLQCRLVCLSWKRVIESDVCLEKLKRDHQTVFSKSFTSAPKIKPRNIPFYVYFATGKNVFGKNHLKNPFGSGDDPHVCATNRRRFRTGRVCSDANCPKFKHWNVIQSGGDGWTVETEPCGSDPLPEHLEGRSCYATSFRSCNKEQLITLEKCGLNSSIMDEIQPHIEVSEWYAKRWDCGAVYRLKVSLLDEEKTIVDEYTKTVDDRDGPNDWHQVSHTFKDYGRGVRYITFRHQGHDTQNWAGWYGSKMAGGSVIARIPV